MTPMAFVFATLFAILILLPVTAVWLANRLGIFVDTAKSSRVVPFPDCPSHTHHLHSDAA